LNEKRGVDVGEEIYFN